MTATIVRRPEVVRPEPIALRSSVLDHATVTEMPAFGLRNNDGLFNSYNSLVGGAAIAPDICANHTNTFGAGVWIKGNEFAVYQGAKCAPLGLNVMDQRSEVVRVFKATEGRNVESALVQIMAANAGLVNLTLVAGFTLQAALSVLIGYAAQRYAGQPVIHMPRAAAEYLLGTAHLVVSQTDGNVYTKSGAPVACGGGYDTDSYVTGGDGVWDLWATGAVYIERSAEIDFTAQDIPGASNDALAMAERLYRVGFDGFIAKASGKVW
jgi:hypothetical protein